MKRTGPLDIFPDFIESGIKIRDSDYVKLEELCLNEDLVRIIEIFNERVCNFWIISSKSKRRILDIGYFSDLVGYEIKMILEQQLHTEIRYYSASLNMFVYNQPINIDYKINLSIFDKLLRKIYLYLSPDMKVNSWTSLLNQLKVINS